MLVGPLQVLLHTGREWEECKCQIICDSTSYFVAYSQTTGDISQVFD